MGRGEGKSKDNGKGRKRDEAGRVDIREMADGDASAVLRIYQAGLDSGIASFETTAPDWGTFTARRLLRHRFVAVDDAAGVVGWVTVSPISRRAAYAGVVENSIYVAPEARGRGIAGRLLATLIESTEAGGIWTIQAGVFPDNEASLRLHDRAGFRTVGTRERIGRLNGQWRDVVLIERRSSRVL
jgi:L-amino acid N-acyltransferase YncA